MLRPVLRVNLSEDVAMPTLSFFYGIKIYMYWAITLRRTFMQQQRAFGW